MTHKKHKVIKLTKNKKKIIPKSCKDCPDEEAYPNCDRHKYCY